MKCPRCGFTGSDYVAACKKCGKDLADARQALGLPPLGRRPARASTSILDGPVEASLIDEAPAPAPAGPRTILDFEEAPVAAASGAKPEPDHIGIADDEMGDGFRPEAEDDFGSGGSRGVSVPGTLAETAPVEPSEIDLPGPDPFMPPPGASNGHAPLDLDLAPASNGNGAAAAPAPAPDWDRPDVPDFGEPLDLDESRVVAPAPAAVREDSWEEDSWGEDHETPAREADPEALPKGGFWMRLVAYLVDRFFLYLVTTAAGLALLAWTGALGVVLDHLPASGVDPEAASREMAKALYPFGERLLVGFGVITLLSFLYRPVCHWLWGKTIGKKLLGLRVVTTDATSVGLLRACVREVGFLLSCLPLGLGLLWVAWDRQKQGWQDKLAGTYVLKENA